MKRAHIKETALRMAEDVGLVNISKAELAEAAGISAGSFVHIVGCKFSEFIEEIAADVPITRVHKSTKSRANPTLRKQQLIAVALGLAVEHGYYKVTRDQIAAGAGVAPGLVSHYLGDMDAAREAILCEAIRAQCLPVIAQGIMAKASVMDQVEDRLKRRALKAAMS